jgi:hypothetical protein
LFGTAYAHSQVRTDKSLVQEVVDDIEPDDSAVVAWVDSADLETVAPAFRGFGGKVLHTTVVQPVRLKDGYHFDGRTRAADSAEAALSKAERRTSINCTHFLRT